MPNFKTPNYNQDTMVVVNFEEQIRPGTFEFVLHHLIEDKLDLSAFYDKYKNDTGSRSAYNPAIFVENYTLHLLQRSSLQSRHRVGMPKQYHV